MGFCDLLFFRDFYRTTLAVLENDNKKLRKEIQQEENSRLNTASISLKKMIDNLESQDKVYERLIKEQQKISEHLLETHRRLQNDIDWQKETIGGINDATERSVRAQRKLILLENKLEHVCTSKSIAETTAKSLKEEVNGLRRERCLFDELKHSTDLIIVEKANEISDILRKISEANEFRNKACAMRAQIQAQAAKDTEEAESEYQRLTQVSSMMQYP